MKSTIARFGILSALVATGCGQQPAGPSVGVESTAARAGAMALTNPTPLQKHLMFFDGDHDGILTLDETKAGLKRLGLNPLTALGGAVFIHAGLQQARAGGLKLDIAKIQFAKHKSDSGAFDAEGRFVPAAFDRMFTFDTNQSGSLSWSELSKMIAANKQDAKGNLASKAEFGLLIKLAADTTETDGKDQVPALSRARLQAVYTGNVFYDVAAEREKSGKKAMVEGALPQ